MITTKEKDRLYWTREVLMDDLGEELRLANITPQKGEEIADIIFDMHDSYMVMLEDYKSCYMSLDEIIDEYNRYIHDILKKL